MLTEKPTPERIQQWKQIYETYHASMKPNRKTGSEVDRYFRNTYTYQMYDDERFRKIVEQNILLHEHTLHKLPKQAKPEINSYRVEDVLVGIDLVSGEFHVEGENIQNVIPIVDDLFVYRGLDEEDLKNYFLVAEYIRLTQT